jgi:hypothetical protein
MNKLIHNDKVQEWLGFTFTLMAFGLVVGFTLELVAKEMFRLGLI